MPPLTRPVMNGHRHDPPPLPHHQCRQKPVHVVEPRHIEEGLAHEHLQPTAGVRGRVLQQSAAHTVGDARGDALHPAVPTFRPQPRHQQAHRIGILPDNVQKLRNIRRIVLSVAVQGDDDGTPRRLDTGGDSCALTGPARVADKPKLRRLLPRLAQALLGRIGAAVVDEDDFIRFMSLQGCGDLIDQRSDIFRLVQDGHDHRHLRHGRIHRLFGLSASLGLDFGASVCRCHRSLNQGGGNSTDAFEPIAPRQLSSRFLTFQAQQEKPLSAHRRPNSCRRDPGRHSPADNSSPNWEHPASSIYRQGPEIRHPLFMEQPA